MTIEKTLISYLEKKYKNDNTVCGINQLIPIKLIKKRYNQKELDNFKKFYARPRLIIIKEKKRFIVTYLHLENSLSVECVDSPSKLEETVKIFKNEITTSIISMIDELDASSFDKLLDQILNDDKILWIDDFQLRKKKKGDGGIDFNCKLKIGENGDIAWKGHGVSKDIAGEIKHQKTAMGTPDIAKLRGALTNNRIKYGLFVSTNGFSGDAHEDAARTIKKIFLIDKYKIAKEIVDNNIGLEKITLGTIKNINEQWWKDIKNNQEH